MGKNFITNRHGAKIFERIDDQPILIIPALDKQRSKGLVVEVLSVDFHDEDHTPMITVKKNKTVNSYILPDWFRDWAELNTAQPNGDTAWFPCKIEFGYIPSEERYYAEVL